MTLNSCDTLKYILKIAIVKQSKIKMRVVLKWWRNINVIRTINWSPLCYHLNLKTVCNKQSLISIWEVGMKGYLIWISGVGNKLKQCLVMPTARLRQEVRHRSMTSGAASRSRGVCAVSLNPRLFAVMLTHITFPITIYVFINGSYLKKIYIVNVNF